MIGGIPNNILHNLGRESLNKISEFTNLHFSGLVFHRIETSTTFFKFWEMIFRGRLQMTSQSLRVKVL
jgi:hypothetical protein